MRASAPWVMRRGAVVEGYWKMLGRGCERASVRVGSTGGIDPTSAILLSRSLC